MESAKENKFARQFFNNNSKFVVIQKKFYIKKKNPKNNIRILKNFNLKEQNQLKIISLLVLLIHFYKKQKINSMRNNMKSGNNNKIIKKIINKKIIKNIN